MNAPHITPNLVSVVVPCYNRAGLVVETLESIVAQTHSPIELIVVDDGSVDGSQSVVQKWADARLSSLPNILKFQFLQQANRGPSAARNRGFQTASGEFIQFLDSDDLLEPRKLEIQVLKLREIPSADFCVCNYVRVDAQNRKIVDRFKKSDYSHSIEDFPAAYPMSTDSPLYRRGIIERAGGYDEGLMGTDDFEFNFRVALSGQGLWVDDFLVRRRLHTGQERIQVASLSRRFQGCSLALTKMELAALEKGVCTRHFLASLAKRALSYEQILADERAWDKAAYFRRYARARLALGCFWATRLRFRVRSWRKRLSAGSARADWLTGTR